MIRFLSLLLTPWAIFVSSSLSLYLLNQENLDYNPAVLLPFVGAAAIGVLVGYGIQYYSQKNQHFLSVPWLIYFAGPLFMLWNTVESYLESSALQWLWLLCAVALCLILSQVFKRYSLREAAPFFALFCALIILSDTFSFVTRLETGKTVDEPSNGAMTVASSASEDHGGNTDLPNIYHVVLDGYQSDLFVRTLDDSLPTALRGFRFFPKNISLYIMTRLSVPSVFAGRTWIDDVSMKTFLTNAFTAPSSMIGRLEEAGYNTTAYLHQEFPFEPNRFGKVFYHHEFATARPWTDRAFLWAWAYAYWPRPFVTFLLGPGVINRIEAGSLSPGGYPVVSLDAFEQFLAVEPDLPASGRYSFLHLLLPHPPYRMTSNCQPRESVNEMEQYRCANMVIMRLVETLKVLGRFEHSMIIIHADHGDDLDLSGLGISRLKNDPESLEFLKIRARALLLYKPAGNVGHDPMIIDETPTTLLDVAPTIIQGFSSAGADGLEGFVLGYGVPRPEERYFYVHDGRDLFRYAIRNGEWDDSAERVATASDRE